MKFDVNTQFVFDLFSLSYIFLLNVVEFDVKLSKKNICLTLSTKKAALN